MAAYAIGLIPFVTIRSAVATFYARKDTATPMKAALTEIAVNVALKVALMGALAQIGLALATAVGAWINLLLVLFFAVRAGYLELDRAWMTSLAKFAAAGVLLAAALGPPRNSPASISRKCTPSGTRPHYCFSSQPVRSHMGS